MKIPSKTVEVYTTQINKNTRTKDCWRDGTARITNHDNSVTDLYCNSLAPACALVTVQMDAYSPLAVPEGRYKLRPAFSDALLLFRDLSRAEFPCSNCLLSCGLFGTIRPLYASRCTRLPRVDRPLGLPAVTSDVCYFTQKSSCKAAAIDAIPSMVQPSMSVNTSICPTLRPPNGWKC